jgi:hypothetical protein
MPIRPELRPLYPADWPALSREIQFVRDGGHAGAAVVGMAR